MRHEPPQHPADPMTGSAVEPAHGRRPSPTEPARPTPGAPHRQGGSSLVEYSLLLALITLVVIGAVTAFGAARDDVFDRSASSMMAP